MSRSLWKTFWNVVNTSLKEVWRRRRKLQNISESLSFRGKVISFSRPVAESAVFGVRRRIPWNVKSHSVGEISRAFIKHRATRTTLAHQNSLARLTRGSALFVFIHFPRHRASRRSIRSFEMENQWLVAACIDRNQRVHLTSIEGERDDAMRPMNHPLDMRAKRRRIVVRDVGEKRFLLGEFLRENFDPSGIPTFPPHKD